MARVGLDDASSMPWVFSQVNRKCLSRCGGMLCASPALAAYRASMARTPRVEYGFFHEDSNRKAAPLSRAALMCRARVSLKVAGKGKERSLRADH